MTNRPRALGTFAESAVVRFLRANGFPAAERRALHGSLDQGDVTGIPLVCVEIKGGNAAKTASDLQVTAWLHETETERVNARADIGVLVLQRAGFGPDRAGFWWAIVPAGLLLPGAAFPVRMHLRDAAWLLRDRGYGEPLEVPA
jgi:hypothetical protein